MALDIDIAKPEPAPYPDRQAGLESGQGQRPSKGRRKLIPGSRLGGLIIALNLLGLAILIGGALVLNEMRRGLVNAQIDSLTTQGEFIANVIDRAATMGEPVPQLEVDRAAQTLQLLFIPRSQRARLFDADGQELADSYTVSDRVEKRLLPPARKPGTPAPQAHNDPSRPAKEEAARKALQQEVARALKGKPVAGMRLGANGDRVVSVSIPLRHVEAVLGVLTLESGDVDEIIAAERRALLPFIIMAIAVSLASSFLLNRLIAQPVLRLARAADRVRLSRARAIILPDLADREDELGDLTRSLQSMTSALTSRMDAIERFAADVAHEIRNPLTSIRSAVETLDIVSEPASRAKLMGILKQDVGRLDRLITDISNASRLDAELSRDAPRPIDLPRLLSDLSALYGESAKPGDVKVVIVEPEGLEGLTISGREGPLSQVFRNLIDNARSFTRPINSGERQVRIEIGKFGSEARVTIEDDGPGIPPENLETVFERFYTSRPRGALFGGNSGLGLSIARQIVEAHSGHIWAENRVDEEGLILGARFSVSLPCLST
jgi:two-component system sensor histidine kinase ChvG